MLVSIRKTALNVYKTVFFLCYLNTKELCANIFQYYYYYCLLSQYLPMKSSPNSRSLVRKLKFQPISTVAGLRESRKQRPMFSTAGHIPKRNTETEASISNLSENRPHTTMRVSAFIFALKDARTKNSDSISMSSGSTVAIKNYPIN